jgi:hypothetical protein
MIWAAPVPFSVITMVWSETAMRDLVDALARSRVESAAPGAITLCGRRASVLGWRVSAKCPREAPNRREMMRSVGDSNPRLRAVLAWRCRSAPGLDFRSQRRSRRFESAHLH